MSPIGFCKISNYVFQNEFENKLRRKLLKIHSMAQKN